MSKTLEFTGERFTPECLREIWYEHLHRYVFAREYVAGKRVLDVACGEGYGSALLATVAAHVTGVDLSDQAVEHAKGRYQASNLTFQQGDGTRLPFEDHVFDVIVSFETLEHLTDQEGLLREFHRVLSPDGFLLISTPDKAVYTDQLGNDNAFHVAELYRADFEALLQGHFSAIRLWGHKLSFHSMIWSLEPEPGVQLQQEQGGAVTSSDLPATPPVYLLAFCAHDPASLPQAAAGLSLFDDAADSVYQHYYHEIRKNMAAGALLEEKEREIDRLRRALEQPRRSWWKRRVDGD